jgi:hypothetical protein
MNLKLKRSIFSEKPFTQAAPVRILDMKYFILFLENKKQQSCYGRRGAHSTLFCMLISPKRWSAQHACSEPTTLLTTMYDEISQIHMLLTLSFRIPESIIWESFDNTWKKPDPDLVSPAAPQ